MKLIITQSITITRKITLFIAMATFGLIARGQYYVQSDCDFSPMATAGTAICLADDAVSGAIPLGFSFPFYGTIFSNCYVSSNGYLSFTAGLGNACCTGAVLPTDLYPYSIFFGQEDLDPNSCIDGDITYYTTGVAGSQVFVLSFTDVPHYPGPEGLFPVTVQVQLYEGTGEIKIVTTQMNGDGGSHTMGLNQNVLAADIVAGRNSTNWSAYEECISFTIFEAAAADAGVIDVTNPISAGDLSLESISVTIQNYGFEAISEFPVSYSVDGGAIVTETYGGTIAPFSTGSYTFSTMYDFGTDGCYEIVSYTGLADDADATNDSYSESVCNLCGALGNLYYVYSNSTGGQPWFTVSNSVAMDQAFSVGGWSTAYYETLDPISVFSDATGFVFLEGSDSHANELETFLGANMTLIEDWVSAGGRLLLNSAPNEGDGMSFGFGGTNLIYDGGSSIVTAADPAHPVFNIPFTPVGTDFTGSNFSHARITGTDIFNIILETGSTDITLGEKPWGAGLVLFGGMTTNNFHSPILEAANLRANILAYASCGEPPVVCEVPSGLYADGITTNDAVLHWSAVDGADQYRVSLQNVATGLIKTKGYYSNMVEITDKLAPLTEYAFRVKTVCYDDLGEISAPSDWYYFTTLGRIGENEASVTMFPNPSNGAFVLQMNGLEANTFELNIFDAIGNAVYNKTITISGSDYTETISLNNVSAGIYQVSLVNADVKLSYPMVIQK